MAHSQPGYDNRDQVASLAPPLGNRIKEMVWLSRSNNYTK